MQLHSEYELEDELESLKVDILKGLQQLTLGQYTVSLNMLVASHVEEFFSKWYNKFLSVDKRAMELAGYDVTNENEWREIDSDFKFMVEIMNTNEDVKKLYETYGDSYITGFYLRKYEFLSTVDIEPTDLVTSRKRNTQTTRYVILLYQYRVRFVTKDIQRFNSKKALYGE